MRGCGLVALAVIGCGRLRFDELVDAGSDSTSGDVGPLVCTPWITPRHVVELNSGQDDWSSAISPAGDTIVFGTNRTGNLDLYIAPWQGAAWSPPTAIATLDQAATIESEPTWSPDGTQLYFFSDRAGNRLYVASVAGGFANPMLVPGLESVNASGATLSSDQLEMIYTVPSGTRTLDRAVRTTTTQPWMPMGPITELNSGMGDGYPTLSSDNLTLYFMSARLHAAGDVFVATRPDPAAPFEPPTLASDLDLAGASTSDPDLSRDGRTVYMTSNRAGGAGNFDLLVATRTCE